VEAAQQLRYHPVGDQRCSSGVVGTSMIGEREQPKS
jgi:hypothetical protein